jgi:hypothetical protein
VIEGEACDLAITMIHQPLYDWGAAMAEPLIQMAIIFLWAATFSIHARRLMRLARVDLPQLVTPSFRQHLTRVWWWLGREEFWEAVHIDGLRCTQLTIMVFLLVWGAYR